VGDVRRKKRRRRAGNLLTGLILLVMILGVGVQLYRLQGQLRSARDEEEALAAQIAQLERENEALSEDLANAGDPSLIEKIAREELGMVMPNEKVFYTYGG
jgi:cell division protein DivIC